MNNLKNSTTVLEEDRRKVLKDVLKERYSGAVLTDYFIDSEIEYIMNSANNGLVMKAEPQEGLTDANKLNAEMQGFEVDIRTMFARLNLANESIITQRRNTESIINEINNSIAESNRKITEVGDEIRNIGSQSILFDDFTDYRNKEFDDKYYTERDGSPVAEGYHLQVHSIDDTLRLPLTNSENTLVNFAGLKMADISLGTQVGGGLIRHRNPANSLDKAIDTSLETYWSETILTDEPFTVNLGKENYDLKFGASVELIISYRRATEINEITMMPFVDFPIEVRAILIYDNDRMENPYELVSPTAVHKSVEDKEVISYQFQRVIAKKVKILLNQQHYIKRDLAINVHDKTLVDAWTYSQGITQAPPEYLFRPLYYDLSLRNPYWATVQEYLKTRDIEEELASYADYSATNMLSISKFEYQYGLYNLAINFNDYAEKGIYVTKPLTNLNIQKIELEAKEGHALMENLKANVTNIEYYVTEKEEPTAEDWLPILPKNIKEIKSELLDIKFTGTEYEGETRFFIDKIHDVRRNGVRLEANIDYSVVGRRIILHNYLSGYIYTVDYIPTPSAYYIDFLDKMKRRVFNPSYNRTEEYVDGQKMTERIGLPSDTNVVKLKRSPFWDRGRVALMEQNSLFDMATKALAISDWNPTHLNSDYLPMEVQIVLPTGETISQPLDESDIITPLLINKTDYHDLERNLLEPFDGTNYQYRIERDELRFNTSLPKGTRLIVNYVYLTGPIRMKMIMRRNIVDETGMTPLLHEYTIGLQSLI